MDAGIEHVVSATKAVKACLEQSKALGSSLDRVGCRFDGINHRLPSLEVAIRPIWAQRDALSAVAEHISRAIVPATAVLKVFDAIHVLEKSFFDPQTDLPGYLGVLKRLEEALAFLGENCVMAIQWLAGIVEYLEDHKVADTRFTSGLKKALIDLQELDKGDQKGRLDGGLFDAGLDRLENEFHRLLKENSAPYLMSSASYSMNEEPSISASPMPEPIIHKLQATLGWLNMRKRVDKCISIYVETRSSTVRESLQALDLHYLELSISEFNAAADKEIYVEKWGRHLEFSIKHLFEREYKLCSDMFERMGLDVWKSCFAKIAASSGIVSFLQFGKTVAESKKVPIKLLNLLDMFASLNRLRLDFNRLFGGPECAEIKNLTRDLIKGVIQGACEIFWELLVQVELQRKTPPPSDCSVPRAVSFITDYCSKLLGDDYKPILVQVLEIEKSWKQVKFHERSLIKEIVSLVRAIELNLETWAKGYHDAVTSCVFLMNNHWHLFKHLKGTKLGMILGDSWLSEQEEFKEYYAAAFVRESWGKLPALLSREGLILFSGGRETARTLVKQRLKSFNEAFDKMYQKQSIWIIPEEDLRDRICKDMIQTVVPIYRSYMQNYGPLVEQDQGEGKYIKYTAQSIEKIFMSLFHPKPMKQGSFKMNKVVTVDNQHQPGEKHKGGVGGS